MNHAYEGLLDLADFLGAPRKALSLNGDLALAGVASLSYFPLHAYPPNFLVFVRSPPVADPTRLCNELGFTLQYTTDSTLDVMVALHQARRRKT